MLYRCCTITATSGEQHGPRRAHAPDGGRGDGRQCAGGAPPARESERARGAQTVLVVLCRGCARQSCLKAWIGTSRTQSGELGTLHIVYDTSWTLRGYLTRIWRDALLRSLAAHFVRLLPDGDRPFSTLQHLLQVTAHDRSGRDATLHAAQMQHRVLAALLVTESVIARTVTFEGRRFRKQMKTLQNSLIWAVNGFVVNLPSSLHLVKK